MISIWNYAAKPQDVTLVLYYSGGQYRIPIHLEARQSYDLDMMTLLKSRAPDPDGNLIPPYIESGSAMLVGPGGELDKMTVVLSASGYNVRNATCFPMCINCGGVVDVTVNGVSLGIPQTAQASAEVDMADGSQLEYGDDALVTVRPVLDRVPHLKALLEADAAEDFSDLRRAETTGRPLCAPEFVSGLEKILGRTIARRAPGRKPTGDDRNQLRLL